MTMNNAPQKIAGIEVFGSNQRITKLLIVMVVFPALVQAFILLIGLPIDLLVVLPFKKQLLANPSLLKAVHFGTLGAVLISAFAACKAMWPKSPAPSEAVKSGA